MTSSNYDPLKFGEVSLGEPDDAKKRVASASHRDALFEIATASSEPVQAAPILGNAPPKSGPRHRNPLPPSEVPAGQGAQPAAKAEVDALTRPRPPRQGSRHGPASRSGKERLPTRKDHEAYSRRPRQDPAASRVVPMVVLLVGLGTAGYLSLVAQHYPMAIFLALISLVAAPLARLIFQGAIE